MWQYQFLVSLNMTIKNKLFINIKKSDKHFFLSKGVLVAEWLRMLTFDLKPNITPT